jgi:hypothetical protein
MLAAALIGLTVKLSKIYSLNARVSGRTHPGIGNYRGEKCQNESAILEQMYRSLPVICKWIRRESRAGRRKFWYPVKLLQLGLLFHSARNYLARQLLQLL